MTRAVAGATPSPPARSGRSSKLGVLGCGCGAVVVALMILMLVFTFVAYRQSERLESGYDSPEEAAAQVRKVLPHEELPEGYYPLGGASVPVFFRLAILTDLPPEQRAGGEEAPRFHRRGFVFFSTFSLRSDDSELTRYFEQGPSPGEEEIDLELPDDGVAGDLGMDFAGRQVIDRGSRPLRGGQVYYVARRGELTIDEAFDGLATVFYIRCDQGRRVRFGLWFAPIPEEIPDDSSNDVYPNTPADPQALTDFLGHFWICD